MIEGTFVVLEGIDGAGTSTQSERLRAHFAARGLPAIVTREPTAGPIGSLIRLALTHRFVVPGVGGSRAPNWKTMALLFAADRLDHLEAEIMPNLLDGVSVVSDRYDLSSLAYQSATSEEDVDPTETLDWLRALNRHARRPDLTIILDVPPGVAEQRRRRRGGAAELYEHEGLQARLAEAYRDASRLVPGDYVHHIDGHRPVDAVAADIAAAVDAFRRHGRVPAP
ncbi:MAG TPA: dTMP kinase [Polyangiaceae bacterium]|nr:dTMP kinase [Polyangiaceae bacterium]